MKTKSIVNDLVEIKRPYQKNVLIGFGISAAFYILIAFTALLFCSKGVEPEKIVVANPRPVFIRPPGPSDGIRPVIHEPPGTRIKPKIGIPKPVPDSQIFNEPEVPTQDQLIAIGPTASIDSLGVGIFMNIDSLASIFPPLDTFIAFQTPPMQVDLVQPKYPDLARRAGIEGKVWLRVLIGKDGKVREVRVDKSTNPNAGFEEAAIAAAWLTVWRPAIAKGLPIRVPVTYAVEFKLR